MLTKFTGKVNYFTEFCFLLTATGNQEVIEQGNGDIIKGTDEYVNLKNHEEIFISLC